MWEKYILARKGIIATCRISYTVTTKNGDMCTRNFFQNRIEECTTVFGRTGFANLGARPHILRSNFSDSFEHLFCATVRHHSPTESLQYNGTRMNIRPPAPNLRQTGSPRSGSTGSRGFVDPTFSSTQSTRGVWTLTPHFLSAIPNSTPTFRYPQRPLPQIR